MTGYVGSSDQRGGAQDPIAEAFDGSNPSPRTIEFSMSPIINCQGFLSLRIINDQTTLANGLEGVGGAISAA